MRFIEKIRIIQRVDQLIRMKATGKPEELAERLQVSRSTVYEIIECMRNMGAEIMYCKVRRSFCYKREKELTLGFVEKNKIRGGKFIGSFYDKYEIIRIFRTDSLYI